MTHSFIPYALFAATALAAFLLRKLTLAGAVLGFLIVSLLYFRLGWNGVWPLALFFALATAATAFGKRIKLAKGIATDASHARDAGQVWANGGVAASVCFFAAFPNQGALAATIISFAAATTDTLSSEVGSVVGRRYFDVLTGKPTPPGGDGVVSIEGFGIGAATALLFAGVSYAFGQSLPIAVVVFVSANLGNLIDSLLGATLERRGILGNNAVNFTSIALATFIGLLLAEWFVPG